jgi:hypothetical protein
MAAQEQLKPAEKADVTNSLPSPNLFNTNSIDSEQQTKSNETEQLKLDSNGLPLVPQPSRFKDDPLVRTIPAYRQFGSTTISI